MTRVRYIADSMAEAISAARRNHGMGVRIVHAGARRGGAFSTLSFEVVVEATSRVTQARRAAREALARAVVAARIAADEANSSVAAASAPGPASAAVIARLGARLRSQSLPEALVEHVLERVRGEAARADLREVDEVGRAAALNAVAALLPVSAGVDPVHRGIAGRPWVVAVAGPTGVGKTTTLAKLAAEWRVGRGLKVGLVAADAFRVGAFEQLRTYARIIDAPVRAADGRASAVDALAALADCDAVLVDTPGRGHRDGGRIGEIGELLGALRPDETHLVLPGSASSRTLGESASAFAAVRPTRIVLSKLDESEGLGALVGAVRSSGVPVSWFTTGQEVPDDIERADARRFAGRLLGAPEEGAE